jgi:hypothetical protein
MGRPRKLVDDDATIKALDGLARIQCTTAEGAAFFRVHRDTFEDFLRSHKRASEAWESGKQDGLCSLRRKQFEMASGGNATMAIWLGKQYLGQKDKTDSVVTVMPHEEALRALQ